MRKVRIEAHNKCLRLRWTIQGHRYTLGLGGLPDNFLGRNIAQEKASQIERDILLGDFDETLLKYRPRLTGTNPTEINCPVLFSKYTATKSALAAGTLEKYRAVQRHLEQWLDVPAPSVDAAAAANFAQQLADRVAPKTQREYLRILASCWDWAKGKYHVAQDNPWPQLAKSIKPEPRQPSQPFSEAEAMAILQGFASNRYYKHYYSYTLFLLGVGCRPGEAAGLRWQHVSADFATAWIGRAITRGVEGTTKTGKARVVALSPGVATMLRELHQQRNPSPEDLVFPAPKGGPINDRLYNRRAWHSILAAAGIPYRSPYNMRHTAISHALANGADPISVAEQAGHDPRTMFAHYAHAIRRESVFKDFVGGEREDC